MDSLYGGESVPSPMDQVAGQDPAINQPKSTGPKRMWRTFSGQSSQAILLQAGQQPEYWIFSVKAEDCVSLDYFQYLQDGETLYLNGPVTQPTAITGSIAPSGPSAFSGSLISNDHVTTADLDTSGVTMTPANSSVELTTVGAVNPCWGDVITMVIPGNFRDLTLLPLTSVNVAYWAAAVSGYDVGPMGPR